MTNPCKNCITFAMCKHRYENASTLYLPSIDVLRCQCGMLADYLKGKGNLGSYNMRLYNVITLFH